MPLKPGSAPTPSNTMELYFIRHNERGPHKEWTERFHRTHAMLCPRTRRGFTLIELLVVIVAVSLLAALVAPNVFRHVGSAKEATARTQIEMLGAALDAYRLDNGRYPNSTQGLEALWLEPAVEPRPRKWTGPYLRKRVPPDPWGNAWVYVSPGLANPTGFDLLSLGADGMPGGDGEDADVKSWEN
jgi:general secretion pathway protein G